MPTPILDAFTDNSLKDDTGDDIGGAEVDANPTITAKILDGTTTTVMGQDGSTGVRWELGGWFEDANAAGSVQDVAFLEWDPADAAAMTDNSSGIGIVWKMPNDNATPVQTEFASLDVICVDDSDGSEDGEFSFKLSVAGTAGTEVLTLGPTVATFTEKVTVGVDDTGYDVQFFGASAGAYFLWDESANTLGLRGATAAGAGTLNLQTAEVTVVDGDILGRIDF